MPDEDLWNKSSDRMYNVRNKIVPYEWLPDWADGRAMQRVARNDVDVTW